MNIRYSQKKINASAGYRTQYLQLFLDLRHRLAPIQSRCSTI